MLLGPQLREGTQGKQQAIRARVMSAVPQGSSGGLEEAQPELEGAMRASELKKVVKYGNMDVYECLSSLLRRPLLAPWRLPHLHALRSTGPFQLGSQLLL